MRETDQQIRVALRADGFTPATFVWEGSVVRVFALETVYTRGFERRYRVGTSLGRFELGFSARSGAWRVRRGPSRLGQWLARARPAARYPLPVWRRRARGRGVPVAGRARADGLTVV
jgi:hypothetical protein